MTINTKAYAVLIGVDDYSTYDPTNKHNLLGSVNDVRAFWDVCVTSGFAPENIHVLSDPPLDPAELGGLPQNFHVATRSEILAQRDALFARLRGDARAVGLLVFSGHGAWIDNALEQSAVICPSDFSVDIGRANNDVPVQALWDGAGANLTVVLDCCHSGDGNRHASLPIHPRGRHKKYLPTSAALEHDAEAHPSPPAGGPSSVAHGKFEASDASSPVDEAHQGFRPLRPVELAKIGLLPIGSAVPLTLSERVLTEADLKYSPYRHTHRELHGAKVLAACDVQSTAYQAEFAGRFHGAFTWALTSTVGQWLVEEAPDGAIRTTIGCGAVKRHAARLLEVFAFDQTPVLHPATAADLPFFGIRGPISENPTGQKYPVQIDPEIKVIRLLLTDDLTGTGISSKVGIANGIEAWTLGSDFMVKLSTASPATHTALALDAGIVSDTPTSPTTAFRMPARVSWGAAVPAPSGPGFYSRSGAGPSMLAMFFQLDMTATPARVVSITWYQGVVGTAALTYPLTNPGRSFTFGTTLPTPPAGLTWFRAAVIAQP